MISAYARASTVVLDTRAENVQQAMPRFQRALPTALRPVTTAVLTDLSTEPPQYRGKRQWKSEKQRIHVMALLRKANNVPYQRTGALVKAWHVVTDFGALRGEARIENPSSVVRFVQGSDVQPMHLVSGWPQFAPTLREHRPKALLVVSETWLVANNLPKASAR